jgi:hypothetical protein
VSFLRRAARAAGLAAALAAGGASAQDEVRVLRPFEHLRNPADQRLVPGYAGAWNSAQVQRAALKSIVESERTRAPGCADIRIEETQAPVPAVAVQRGRGHDVYELERWDGRACAERISYDVWKIVDLVADRGLVFANPAGRIPEEALRTNPAMRRLKQLYEARTDPGYEYGERLYYELPAGWARGHHDAKPVPPGEGRVTAVTEYVPRGQSVKDWQELFTLLGFYLQPLDPAQHLKTMQELWHKTCGSRLRPVAESLQNGYRTASTLLVCPDIKQEGKAEIALAKAIGGRDHFYVLQKAWRLPAAGEDALEQSLKEQIAAWRERLRDMQLCDSRDRERACERPVQR